MTRPSTRGGGREISFFFKHTMGVSNHFDHFCPFHFSGKMDNTAITREFYQLGLELEDEMQLLHELGQYPENVHAYSEFGGFETAEAQAAFFECAIRVTRIRKRMRELHCQMVINRL